MTAVSDIACKTGQSGPITLACGKTPKDEGFGSLLEKIANENLKLKDQTISDFLPPWIRMLQASKEPGKSSKEEKTIDHDKENANLSWTAPAIQTVTWPQAASIQTPEHGKRLISNRDTGSPAIILSDLKGGSTNPSAGVSSVHNLPQEEEAFGILPEGETPRADEINPFLKSFAEEIKTQKQVSSIPNTLQTDDVSEKKPENSYLFQKSAGNGRLSEGQEIRAIQPAAGQKTDAPTEKANRIIGMDQGANNIRLAADKSAFAEKSIIKTGELPGQLRVKKYNPEAAVQSDRTDSILWTKTRLEAANPQMISDHPVIQTPAYMQVCNKVLNHIKENGTHKIQMKLYPEGLGEIHITLTCKDSAVSLDILTDNAAARKLLESQAGELRGALTTKNYEVSNVSISGQTESSQTSANGFSFFEGSASGNPKWQFEKHPAFGGIEQPAAVVEEATVHKGWQDVYSGRINVRV